jgi:hypothetical protein
VGEENIILNLVVHKVTARFLKHLRNWETAKFEVLTAAFLTIQVFWAVRAC